MKKYIIKLSLTIGLIMTFSACSINPKIYSNKTPVFKINEYFNGEVSAFGVLQDWKGRVTRTFTVKMQGDWKGNEGTLKEWFVFDDGEKSERIWKVKLIDENNFTASATDSKGDAKGEQYGNTLRMQYTLNIPYKGKTMPIALDDWMYLVDDNNLINISQMKKFGLPVGKISIGFVKK